MSPQAGLKEWFVGLPGISWTASHLEARRFVTGAAWIAGGTGAGQILLLAASPILTRLYTPEDFGVLAVYSSILSMLLIVAALRWELAIPLPADDERAIQVFGLSALSVAGASLVVAAASYLVGPRLARAFSVPEFIPYLWLLPLGVAGGGLYKVLNYWAIRRQVFDSIGRTKFAQSFGQAGTQVGLGFLGASVGGLLIGDVIGRICGSGGLAKSLWGQDWKLLDQLSVRRLRAEAFRFRDFPLLSAPASLLQSGSNQLPPILIATLYGSGSAGLFLVAYKVVAAPTSLLGRAVSQVYLERAAELRREDHKALQTLIVRIAAIMAGIALVPALVLGFVGPSVFGFVFGSEWTDAGMFGRYLAILLVVKLAVSPVAETLNILERQHLQLVWGGVRLAGVVSALVAPAYFGYSTGTAVLAFSVVAALLFIGLLVATYVVVGQGEAG